MKNPETTSSRINSTLIQSVFILLAILFAFQANTLNAQVKGVGQPVGQLNTTSGSTYNQLFNSLKNGKCYNTKITSVSVKNNNYAFTTFSRGFLKIESGYNIDIKQLQTEFDDKNNFQGAKTIENLTIYKIGSENIGVVVNMQTWGNKSIKLKDAKIVKEPYGYFITGKATDGNRTVYYTIGIYETDCLI